MSESIRIDARTPARAEGASLGRVWLQRQTGRFHPLPYLGVLVGMTLLYALTSQRTVSWQDSGMYQWRILTGEYVTEGGLALAHPLYIAIGQIAKHIPLGTPWAWLSVFSGAFMAVAMANLAAVVALLTGRWVIGILTAVTCGLLHTCWWLSTVAEVYTLSVAALTAELWLLVLLLRRPRASYLVGLALVAGLHLSVHNLGLLAMPVYLAVAGWLVASRQLRARSLAAAGAAYLAGAGPYLWLIGRELAGGAAVGAVVRSALVGSYSQAVLNTELGGGLLAANAAISAMNLASPLAALAVLGWVVSPRRLPRRVWLVVAGLTAVHVGFVARYNVPDQFTFLLPSLVMLAVAAGMGIAWLADRWPQRAGAMLVVWMLAVAVGPPVMAAAPAVARRLRPDPRQVTRPFRDEMRYWLVPWKHNERSAELFARAALEQAKPDGIIVADSTSIHPLLILGRGEGLSGAVEIQYRGRPIPAGAASADAIVRAAGGRAVYLANPKDPGFSARLVRWGRLEQRGVLWLWLPEADRGELGLGAP